MALFIFKDTPQFVYWAVRLLRKQIRYVGFCYVSARSNVVDFVAWFTELLLFLELLFWNLRLWNCGCKQICTYFEGGGVIRYIILAVEYMALGDLLYLGFMWFWITSMHLINDQIYRGADKSLARPGRKQGTMTEDFEFYISYLKS